MTIPGVGPGLNPEYIGYQFQTGLIAFIILDVLFVSLRYLSRWLAHARLGIDDFLMVPAVICNLALAIAGMRKSEAVVNFFFF
jgi:Na+/H+-dicarboxylate symporter